MTSSPKLEDLAHLSTTEWRVFSVLSRQGEPVTIRQIEAALEVSQPTMESIPYGTILVLLQRLIKKGYVSQRPLTGTNAHVYWALHAYDAVLRRQATRLIVPCMKSTS